MSASPQPMVDDRPDSPCIAVCTLDDAEYCIGCRRSSAEIGAWTRMTAAEQWAVIEDLPNRTPEG